MKSIFACLPLCGLLAVALAADGDKAEHAGEADEAARETATTRPAATMPRIAMLWSPAEIRGERMLDNIARHDVIVIGPEDLGLAWDAGEHRGLAERFQEGSAERAREMLDEIHERNPHAVVLVEQYFFEDDKKAYPPDHEWWLRDEKGRKRSFWPGTWRMDVSNAEYGTHVARRIRAIHEATDGQAGVFLDNVRYDNDSRIAWVALLKLVREMCGDEMPILVNAGWLTEDRKWLAPYVNGIMYEDSIHHRHGRMTEEGFYAHIAEIDSKLRSPRISVNEVFGKRADTDEMRRELIRTLIYTDMAFLYSDSTHGHRHAWHELWDAPLGEPVDGPCVPAEGRLARRAFAGGLVLWLPADAEEARTVELDPPMRDAAADDAVTEVKLAPGEGVILLSPDADAPTEAGP